MKTPFIFLLICQFAISFKLDCEFHGITKRADMNACQLASSEDIPFEVHDDVITEDNYIITMHRLPRNDSKRRYPVLLMHGLLQSSDVWLLNNRRESLAWLLWDEGYDVWMGNVRGNYYSRNHTQYAKTECFWDLTWSWPCFVYTCPTNITDPEKFWAFSFDEMGKYDLPAMLERIKKVTGRNKVNYVGHSQGSVVLFSAVAQLDNDFNRKINKFFALAPAAAISRMNTSYGEYLNETSGVYKLFDAVYEHEAFPRDDFWAKLKNWVCYHFTWFCEEKVTNLAGKSKFGLDPWRQYMYFKRDQSGTSMQNIRHWVQMKSIAKVRREEIGLRYYDFGSNKTNMEHYNQTEPPLYDLSTFDIPTYFFCGTRDAMVFGHDCKRQVRTILKINDEKTEYFKINGYNHADFIYGKNAYHKVYERILKQIK